MPPATRNPATSTVLNPQLYSRLRELFPGGVLVANQGEAMFATSTYNAALRRHLTAIRSSGEYYRVSCPFCGDTRHRLWVNHMFGHVDGDGQRMYHLAICYNENCLAKSENFRTFVDAVCGFRNARERHQGGSVFHVLPGSPSEDLLHEVVLPGRLFPIRHLPSEHPAYQYMVVRRRYTFDMLQDYEVCFCTEAEPRYSLAQDRIVFPIRMNGGLVGWQCRYADDLDWRATNVPKYYTCPGMRKRLMLYNYDRARHMPYVVVVEGVTDVHRVGDTAVAVLGKTISQPQQQLLLSTWTRKPIVLMFDPDAREEMRGAVQDLVHLGSSPIIEAALPPGPDPGDWEREALHAFVHAKAREAGVSLPTIH